jgi:hypothetical protein
MLNKPKIGSMAVMSFDFDEWFKNESNVNNTVKVNKKYNKKIVHPLLLTYSELITDVFWIKKFQLWASGKLPKNFTLFNNVITFINKNGVESTWQPTGNHKEDAQSCIQFFSLHAGLFSKKDELEARYVESEDEEEEEIQKTWSQINKNEQEILIRTYVNELAQSDMNLNNQECKLLLQSIRLGIATKNISNQSIEMKNNKIINIKGILWNAETRQFRVNYTNKK